MWWAIPLATTVMGMDKARRQADAKESYNKAQAELTKYSPWTGMRGQIDTSYSPTMLEGGLQGGIQGMGMMQAGQSAFGGAAAAPAGGGMTGDDYFSYSNPNRSAGEDFYQYSNPFRTR